ncbi:MAG: hypothetical protein QW633_00420 [Candidatus Aenigmatarchaeota archaeon]
MDNSIIILESLAKIRDPALVWFFTAIYYFEYLFLAVLFVLYYLRVKNSKFVLTKLIFLIIGFIFIYFLKYIIAIPRPYLSAIEKRDFSFPSTHMFISGFSISIMPAYDLFKYLSYLYFFFLVPTSILYLGLHYVSDMIAGFFIGMAFSFSTQFIEKFSNRKAYRKKH